MTDLHLTADRATDAERQAVDAALVMVDAAVVHVAERMVRGGATRARDRRHLLLPALHALQADIGWISPGGLNYVADQLQVPPADAYGVATFYDLFRTAEPDHAGATTHVCVDAACRIAPSMSSTVAAIEAAGGHVHESPCLGLCDRAPGVFVQGRGEPDAVPTDGEPSIFPQRGEPGLRVLRRLGVVDPSSIDSYVEHGGFEALAEAQAMGADAVIEAVAASGLSGRGGAAFPTGMKWRAVRDAAGDAKHVVANADESEPGTFKDRMVMEHDPFALVESMCIAALATGAQHGWIYIRGEYPRATTRLRHAIGVARERGYLGESVGFDIEVRRGAGAYICGEETALFNSLEGYRGEPRNKPPYPTTNGLFDQPTAVNNPETLLNVLSVVTDGADVYRSVGTESSPGTRLFCVSGRVGRPGLYELPFGTSLRDLLVRAGGVDGDLQAVLLGGAAGAFVGPEHLDLSLCLEATREAGVTLGSGVVMVFDRTVDMADVVVRIAEFFRHESCGQCVPCRVGTVRQHETLVSLEANGSLSPRQRSDIDDMAQAMADASICGLGHTAAGAVRSAIELGLIGGGS